MNPIRRELLNGLLVLVVASLLSVAFSAFQVSFNAQLWVFILIGIAVAVSYVMFEITLKHMASSEEHEKEWLKRIGTPAKLEMYPEGPTLSSNLEALRTLSPGSDYTAFSYFGGEGGGQTRQDEETRRDQNLSLALERTKGGTLREYKRIICFDHDVFMNDPDLRAGILRSGSGAGTIDRAMGTNAALCWRPRDVRYSWLQLFCKTRSSYMGRIRSQCRSRRLKQVQDVELLRDSCSSATHQMRK